VSSEGHPEQSAPIRARSRALIGGLCEDTAPQTTPTPTDPREIPKRDGSYRARDRFFFAGFMMLPRQFGAPHLQT
jgi:hypothetical protein